MKNLSLAVSDFEKFVFTRGDQVVTTSNFVAEAFGKLHKNVLRDIDVILTQVPDSSENTVLSRPKPNV